MAASPKQLLWCRLWCRSWLEPFTLPEYNCCHFLDDGGRPSTTGRTHDLRRSLGMGIPTVRSHTAGAIPTDLHSPKCPSSTARVSYGPLPHHDRSWPYDDYTWCWGTVERFVTFRRTASLLANHQIAPNPPDQRSLGCDGTTLCPLQPAWRAEDEHPSRYLRWGAPHTSYGNDRNSTCENCVPQAQCLYSLMQAIGCLNECTSMMQCKIYHNDRELMQNYIWAWDGDFVVLRMKPIPINEPSDSEIESPHPMRAALRSPSTTSDSDMVAIPGGQTPPPPGHQAAAANRPILYHVHRPDFGEGMTMSGRILGEVDAIPQDQQLSAIWDDTANGDFDLYDIDETYYRDFDHVPPMRVLVIVVWPDFNRAAHLRGVLMHLRVNARREIKAIPLARETSELGILAWLRMLDLCIRQRTMTCKVFHNNTRARGAEPIQLWHADYLRVEATTTGRSVQTPLLTATTEYQDSREHRDGEAFWPRPPTVRSRTEAQSLVLGRNVQPRCHAGFWVFAAWWANILLFIALSWLPNPPTKGRKPRRRHGTGWKRARTAAWLILLISAEQILPVASIHLMPPTLPLREPTTVIEQKSPCHSFNDPCRGLPPPGNPGCTGTQCRYDAQVAEGIWGALRSMYRPVATPMRAGRSVVVNLANHLTFDEAQKNSDSPHPEESRHSYTQGLDAPRRDNTFSMYVGDDFMDDRHGLTVPWLETPAPHPSTFVDDLHPSAFQLLFTNIALEDDDMRYIHIFTDGSAGKGDDGYFSAWAFCIFESNSSDDDMSNAKYVQWYGNGCTIDAMDPQWIGATEHTSKVAEAEALTWALLWTLQLEDNRKVCIHADATSVLFPATGQWNFQLSETLMRRLRATHQLAYSMRTADHLQCAHVKAHSGHPGNEMADSIAVTIRRHPDRARPPPISVAKWYQGEPPTIEWLWATFDPAVRPHQVPDYEDGYLRWTDVDKEKYVPWLQIENADNSKGPTEMHLTFTMASFNVSTLKQPARAAYLRRQFTDRRIVLNCRATGDACWWKRHPGQRLHTHHRHVWSGSRRMWVVVL